MGKVYEAGPDVIVIMRHDPGSSDPVDIGSVLAMDFFGDKAISQDELLNKAERWAAEREIQFIIDDCDTDEERANASSLTPANLAQRRDIWFEPVIMPMLSREAV